jgi:hypothetical protein
MIALSLLMSTIYAAAFHLLKGRNLKDLFFFWLAATIGFFSGQIVGYRLDLPLWKIGQVRMIEASTVAILFLILSWWIRQDKDTA